MNAKIGQTIIDALEVQARLCAERIRVAESHLVQRKELAKGILPKGVKSRNMKEIAEWESVIVPARIDLKDVNEAIEEVKRCLVSE